MLDIGSEQRFSHFKLQLSGVNLMAQNGFPNVIEQMRVAELAHRQIDRHTQLLVALLAPTCQLCAGRIDHPVANWYDQSIALQCVNKEKRRKQAALRMPPADQGLKSDQLLIMQSDLRLIVEFELFLFHSNAQLCFEGETGIRIAHEFVGENVMCVFAFRFSAVKGQICLLQQFIGVLAVLGCQGYTNAAANGHRAMTYLYRFFQGAMYTTYHHFDLFGGDQPMKQQTEFIAAETSSMVLTL